MASSWIVGLTGGIGSGKSAAAEIFARLGAAVVDTDVVAHELTAPGGAAIESIRTAFGDNVIAADGSLERASMRRLVFSNMAARANLEGILHPMIRSTCFQRCASALAAGAPYGVLVVPLLIERGGYLDRLARIVVVDCSEETQIARAMARSGLSRQEVIEIMAVQAKRADRLALAHDVIANDGGFPELQSQVEVLHRHYMQLADIFSAQHA